MIEPKVKSYTRIIHYVAEFCLSLRYGEHVMPGYKQFISNIHAPPEVGDLCALGSAPASEWSFSWLLDIEARPGGWNNYLLESCMTGAQGWWRNVSLSHLDREVVREHPEWRWTDRQWAFKEKWFRVCHKECGAYITLPTMPQFGVGYEVTLGARVRFGLSDYQPTETLPDWRKVTKAAMKKLYEGFAAERTKAER